MSTKKFSSKRANVKLVQNRKPLARAIALALMAGTVVSINVWAGTLYTVDSGGNLYTVDHSSGATSFIGATGGSTDIASDCSNLYNVNWSTFSRVDPMTGKNTVIGNIGYSVNALAVSSSGKLYAAGGSDFIEINPITGAATKIGSYENGYYSSGDLAFDSDGKLYATVSGGDRLVTVDVNTGKATLIGAIGYSTVYGLSFKDGVLYGVTESGLLLKINTATGAGTPIGSGNGKAQWGLTTWQEGCDIPPPKVSSCDIVKEGLVACYPFDGNANDGSGNGNNGTVNGATLTADRFGKTNSAYRFDGVDDYIRIKNSDTLNPKQITVSAWYFATQSFSGDGNNVIIHKPYTSHTPPYYQWHLGVGGDQYNNSGNFSFDGCTAIPTAFTTGGKKMGTTDVVGKWNHITTSFDGTVLKVYVNGKLEKISTTLPNSSPISSYNTDVFIGKHGSLSRQSVDYTPGVIDDLRLYNRALTEAEIKQLYTGASTEIVATPPASICAGSTFNVTIRVNKQDKQPIDGTELVLKFDKSKLKVNSVTNSGVMDTVVTSDYDNTTGTINFSAGAWDKPAPTDAFDLFTINFTALSSTAGTTLLDFLDDSLMLTSGGETINVMATDNTLTLNQCLNYKVNLQRANPIGNASWVTDLKVSLGSATSAVEYPTTCQANGTGTLVLSKPVATGDYICVKNSHTLANKVVQPFGNPVDFRTLLEGDATNNNTVDALDFSFLTNHKGCKGAASTKYDPQADFNVSSCVDAADLALYKANYKKPSGCKWNATSKMYRKGVRDGNRNTVTLGATTLPTGLKVGDTFAYTIQVNANEAQAADGAAVYLNFDPTQLQVNGLQTGQSFDVTLEDTFDNTKGEINFAAGVWDNPAPTQTVELVTIKLTLLQSGGEQTLAFSTTEDRQTMIAGSGEEVTALSEDGNVVVEPVTITPPPVITGDRTAHGTLHDDQGNPIAGVTIDIDGKTATTDALGNWEINGLLDETTYTVTASKDGYTFAPTTVDIGNETLMTEVTITPLIALKMLVKPSTYENLKQGEDLTYTMTIVNGGSQTATGVTLSNILPEGATLVALESIEGSCDVATLTCTLPNLTLGATAVVTLTLHNDLADTLKTTATLTSNEYPVDVKTSFKAVKPHLSVTLVDTPDPVVMQSGLHYQAVVELSAFAPENIATDIAVVLQLPTGTELVDVTTKYGKCDSSAYPVVSCQLDDLSIATPDSISRAVVDVNVKLTDASLLILTHEAKVSAANYPAHIDRERTNIVVPPNAVADVVLVVDTTKSMDEELNGVIVAIEKFIQEQVVKGGMMPQVALVEFKDNVTLRAFTNDMNALLKSVRSLTVEGGGLCPEASAEALNLAISHTKEGGVIVFSTDASPYPDADMAALTTQIKDKGIVLKALISGDCTDGEKSWNDIEAEKQAK